VKYLTFDPGVNGGVAHNMGKLATAWGMPATESDLVTEILSAIQQDERGELKAVVEEEKPDLVLMGKQSIDGDNNAVGQMLAALLDWPQATFAGKLAIEGGKAVVTREVDGGLQTVAAELPAVVSVDLRLNTPRYASLPNIMKAKKKEIAMKAVADYGVDTADRLKVLKVTEPPKRSAGVKVESAAELVETLKSAGVL
jgi:electron transfer flavoprotein beta subunit